MKITYFGHSCFTLQSGGYTVALDPYDEKVPGYQPLSISADRVCCSHEHFDHCYVSAVAIKDSGVKDPFSETSYLIPHDDEGGAKRGMNKIRVFCAEGRKVIHFGDTGCMPSDDYLEAFKGADAIMIPVGGFFTIDPAQAKAIADAIKPRLLIPMHYRDGSQGLSQIAEIGEFLSLCKDAVYEVRKLNYGESIEI